MQVEVAGRVEAGRVRKGRKKEFNRYLRVFKTVLRHTARLVLVKVKFA